jgi:Tfp pilus assembly protein PilZ
VGSRRQEPRLTINKEFDSFDQFVREYVMNISRSGVFIKTAEPLAVGSIVNLRFTVVMDGIETIEGEGEVVRVEQNPAGMGVVFKRLGHYSQNLVEKLLTQRSDVERPHDG